MHVSNDARGDYLLWRLENILLYLVYAVYVLELELPF
jgi:hypothetical protein